MMVMTKRMLDSMRRLYARGMSYRMIADSLGISNGTVCYWLRKMRSECPKRTHSEEWWERTLANARGMSADELAKRIGCHRTTIYEWRRRLG